MGALTTHALDTARGLAAAGMRIDLSVRDGENWRLLKTVWTNQQGRTDAPLLAASEMIGAELELNFHVGEYFSGPGVTTSEPPFLNRVPIRFTIAHVDEHYHVPLLVTPWSYSTYRGS